MNIEQEILEIKKRNKRVEKDKAWEKSKTRIISICVTTYIFIFVFSFLINDGTNLFFTSAIPVIGFFLSTQGLPLVRKFWERKNNKWK